MKVVRLNAYQSNELLHEQIGRTFIWPAFHHGMSQKNLTVHALPRLYILDDEVVRK